MCDEDRDCGFGDNSDEENCGMYSLITFDLLCASMCGSVDKELVSQS